MIKMLLDRAKSVGELSQRYAKIQADLVLLVHYLHNAVGLKEDFEAEILAIDYGLPEADSVSIICRAEEDVDRVVSVLLTKAHLTCVKKPCEIRGQSFEIPFFAGRVNDYGEYPSFYVMGDPTFGDVMRAKGRAKIDF